MNILIPDIRVYNPKTDGIDLKNYNQIKSYLKGFGANVLYFFEKGLNERVLDSKIEKGITLRDFLLGEEGYFKTDSRKKVLIFIDGGFYSRSDLENIEEKIDELAERKNSIPFAFSHILGDLNIYFAKNSK